MITFAQPIDRDTLRIRYEFMSAADLRASAGSIAARLQIAAWHAAADLDTLVVEGFLERTADGLYQRAGARKPA